MAANTTTLEAKDGIRLKITRRKQIKVKSGWDDKFGWLLWKYEVELDGRALAKSSHEAL